METEKKEHLAIKEIIEKWKTDDLLPISKMFNIEIAYDKEELEKATEEMLKETLGAKYKKLGESRAKNFVKKVEERNNK